MEMNEKMYVGLEEAVKELQQRQKNIELVKKVNKFLGSGCPIPQGPNGFLARPIASARWEDFYFKQRCEKVGLFPISLEYTNDLFATYNPSKARLARIYWFDGYGKNGGAKITKEYLVEDINAINGLPLSQIKIKNGELLVEFHHRLRNLLGLGGKIIDVSDWLKSIGPAKKYYPYLLAAAVTRGILFESFESPGFPDLEKFKKEVVIPAWDQVVEKFGVPLVVYHPDPNSGNEENILNWYPREISRFFNFF